MTIPTEPIGSVPMSEELIAAMPAAAAGSISQSDLDALFDEAVLRHGRADARRPALPS